MIEIAPIQKTKTTTSEEQLMADHFRVTSMHGAMNYADSSQSVFIVDWEVGIVENDEFIPYESDSATIEGNDAANLLSTQTTGNSTVWDETEASVVTYLEGHGLL